MSWRRMLLAIMLSVAASIVPAISANADPIGGYSGWSNNHGLPYAVSTGDLVAFWQTILYADGFLPLCGGSIDGYWGGTTSGATYDWQVRQGIGADGTVGPETWGEANRWNYGGSTYFGNNSEMSLASGGYGLFFQNPAAYPHNFQTTDHYGISFTGC